MSATRLPCIACAVAAALATSLLAAAPGYSDTEFLVSAVDPGLQYGAKVGIDAQGNFWVTWVVDLDTDTYCDEEHGPDSLYVHLCRYATGGAPLGADLTVAADSSVYDDHSSIAVGRAGAALLAWDS